MKRPRVPPDLPFGSARSQNSPYVTRTNVVRRSSFSLRSAFLLTSASLLSLSPRLCSSRAGVKGCRNFDGVKGRVPRPTNDLPRLGCSNGLALEVNRYAMGEKNLRLRVSGWKAHRVSVKIYQKRILNREIFRRLFARSNDISYCNCAMIFCNRALLPCHGRAKESSSRTLKRQIRMQIWNINCRNCAL